MSTVPVFPSVKNLAYSSAYYGYYTEVLGSQTAGHQLARFTTPNTGVGMPTIPGGVWTLNTSIYSYSQAGSTSSSTSVPSVGQAIPANISVTIQINDGGAVSQLGNAETRTITGLSDFNTVFQMNVPSYSINNTSSAYLIITFNVVGPIVSNQVVQFWTQGDYVSDIVTTLSPAAGPTGPIGPSGSTGSTGPQGTPGTPGTPGAAGAAGINGTNAAITGSITLWSTAVPPSGWLLCDGTPYLTSTYAALYSVIGFTYGSTDTELRTLSTIRCDSSDNIARYGISPGNNTTIGTGTSFTVYGCSDTTWNGTFVCLNSANNTINCTRTTQSFTNGDNLPRSGTIVNASTASFLTPNTSMRGVRGIYPGSYQIGSVGGATGIILDATGGQATSAGSAGSPFLVKNEYIALPYIIKY